MPPLVRTLTGLFLTVLASLATAQSQNVRVAVDPVSGDEFQVKVHYRTSDGSATTGLGIRLHYDTDVLRMGSPTDVLEDATGIQMQADQDDHDNDPSTNEFITAAWFDLDGNWPAIPSEESRLFTARFSLRNDSTDQPVVLNITSASAASGYRLEVQPFARRLISNNQYPDGEDPDESGGPPDPDDGGAGNDALEQITSLQENLRGNESKREHRTVMQDAARALVDGSINALTDGLLIFRYAFGFRGSVLVNNAVAGGAERSTAEQIEGYLEMWVP